MPERNRGPKNDGWENELKIGDTVYKIHYRKNPNTNPPSFDYLEALEPKRRLILDERD